MNPKVGDEVDCKYLKVVENSIPGMGLTGQTAQVECWGRFKVDKVEEDGFMANDIKYYWMNYGSHWMDVKVAEVVVDPIENTEDIEATEPQS